MKMEKAYLLKKLRSSSIKVLSEEQKELRKIKKGRDNYKIAKNKVLLTVLSNNKSKKPKMRINSIFPLKNIKILYKGKNGLEIANAKSWYLDKRPEPSIELDNCCYIYLKEVIAINEEAIMILEKRKEEILNSKEYKIFKEKDALYQSTLINYEKEYKIISDSFHKRYKELEEERNKSIQKLLEETGFSKIQKERDAASAELKNLEKKGI